MTLPFLKNRVSVAERAFLARQLATMLSSGLAIDRAVAILANQTTNPYLANVLRQIESDLETGLAFSTAIAKHPKVFSRVFVNVVIAGEAVGKLAEVLVEMAERLEREYELLAKIRGALYYPAFVLAAMVIIGAILMARVLPQLKTVFEESGVNLPVSTRILIALADFLANQWWLAIIILAVGVYGFFYWLKSKAGQLAIDYLAVRLPIGLIKDFYMARFARTLALLVQSGTPIIEALAITGEVMSNSYYRSILEETRNDIARGIPMSVPLSKTPLFPVIVSQMVLVGEQTGRLDQILTSLAGYYEQEADTKLKAVSSLFEPAVIVLIGLAVAFMVFSIFIPIYQIAQFQ